MDVGGWGVGEERGEELGDVRMHVFSRRKKPVRPNWERDDMDKRKRRM